jgi:hypothetical protein
MTDRVKAMPREALTWPSDERADVAAELLASLDDSIEDSAAVQAAWANEIEKRGRRVLADETLGEPWEDLRERLIGRLAPR